MTDVMQESKDSFFPQKPIIYPAVGLLVVYSMAASLSSRMLTWIDQLVTPLVSSLQFIGLGIVKPPIDGPMPGYFYTNIVGIGVWFVVVYNVVTIHWLIANRKKMFSNDARQQYIKKMGWGPIRSWCYGFAAFFLFALPFSVFCTLALLNATHGWFVFHVKDFIVPVITVMVWVYPGALISYMWFLIGTGIARSVFSIFRFASRF